MKFLTVFALLMLAASCTETRIGPSSIDQKYGDMGSSPSRASRAVDPGNNAMQGSGGTALPWKGFKAY